MTTEELMALAAKHSKHMIVAEASLEKNATIWREVAAHYAKESGHGVEYAQAMEMAFTFDAHVAALKATHCKADALAADKLGLKSGGR